MRKFFVLNDNSKNNKFLTIQNTQEDIIGELEAIIQYERHYIETDDPSAKATIADILSEEQVHVGQLFGLLFSLDKTAQTQFEKGYNEFIADDNKS